MINTFDLKEEDKDKDAGVFTKSQTPWRTRQAHTDTHPSLAVTHTSCATFNVFFFVVMLFWKNEKSRNNSTSEFLSLLANNTQNSLYTKIYRNWCFSPFIFKTLEKQLKWCRAVVRCDQRSSWWSDHLEGQEAQGEVSPSPGLLLRLHHADAPDETPGDWTQPPALLSGVALKVPTL